MVLQRLSQPGNSFIGPGFWGFRIWGVLGLQGFRGLGSRGLGFRSTRMVSRMKFLEVAGWDPGLGLRVQGLGV